MPDIKERGSSVIGSGVMSMIGFPLSSYVSFGEPYAFDLFIDVVIWLLQKHMQILTARDFKDLKNNSFLTFIFSINVLFRPFFNLKKVIYIKLQRETFSLF